MSQAIIQTLCFRNRFTTVLKFQDYYHSSTKNLKVLLQFNLIIFNFYIVNTVFTSFHSSQYFIYILLITFGFFV